MARRDPIDAEKRSYSGVWLVLSLLLLVVTIWALADDNVFRRPWKYYQAEFGRLQIHKVEDAIAAEDARLAADPEYQKVVKQLATAKAALASGKTAARLASLQADLEKENEANLEKDLNLRFVKSELEELRFRYDDALHHGRPTESLLKQIQAKSQVQVEREKIFKDSEERIAALQGEIKDLESGEKDAEDALVKLRTTRNDLQQKLDQMSLGRLPGPSDKAPFVAVDWQPTIPKIQQAVLEGFDLNTFNQPVARVDRCTTCHAAIDKPGFENEQNPYKTHPNRALYLGKHPTDKYGCTPCHNGDGVAVNSVEQAHASYKDADGKVHPLPLREHLALFRGKMMQAGCLSCHDSVVGLDGAETAARGEQLFVELGCHGCHLTEGYEDLSKIDGTTAIGPSLRRIGAKVDPAWLVRWVRNPHEFRPRTRMPNFMFNDDQAVAVAAYLLDASRDASKAWAASHTVPEITATPDAVARGRAVMDTVGCRACHALAPDEVAGQLGADKDIVPNLSRIAEKVDKKWIYNWIKNPRDYSPIARMPSLRLSEDEARDVTAYLSTLGTHVPGPPDLAARLADPNTVEAGKKLVRKYGCPGCHDIPGMEKESRIGAEMSTFGDKAPEELFFGNRVNLEHEWQVYVHEKIKQPRGYATKWIEQVMPQFDLTDEDIDALVVFLRGRTEAKVPASFRANETNNQAIIDGQRLVGRYNCTGCHIIDGRGGDVRRLYQKSLSSAPPNLLGEGKKVQAEWLFNFLKAPVTLRPWLHIRMPTFHMPDDEAYRLVRYFEALDKVKVPFVHIDPADYRGPNVEAGARLASPDYLGCFSCHVRGTTMPEGDPSSWAPNLALAHARLRPDWILAWLHDPQKLLPGTKMPTFYPDPDNPDGPEDILGGDDEAQMRALRDYVISIGLPAPKSAPAVDQVARAERATDDGAASAAQ
jgi:mono/diheme cytochrome c family protein